MLYIIIFFLGHWYASLFLQSFLHHRYGTHGVFTMNSRWEKVFMIAAGITQGTSYLIPRAYAVMHHKHHDHSDTKDDPHSPWFFTDIFSMMWETKRIYEGILLGKIKYPGKNQLKEGPHIRSVEKFFNSWQVRIGFALFYTAYYIAIIYFVLGGGWYWLWLLLLPVHYLMSPVHGALVNWFGHKAGYRNWDTRDHSHNFALWIVGDILLLGEWYQNNHHQRPSGANFAHKWYEFDPSYPMILLFNFLGIIQLPKKTHFGNRVTH